MQKLWICKSRDLRKWTDSMKSLQMSSAVENQREEELSATQTQKNHKLALWKAEAVSAMREEVISFS